MKYFIITGEASGDLHASNIVKQLKKIDSKAEFVAWGGNRLKSENVVILKHIKTLAFMGFWEVIKNIRTILKNIKLCIKQIEEQKPDITILVDFPGFNMKIAKYLSDKNYKFTYFVSPQIWAWKESRITKIKKYIKKMIVILPFEKDYYQQKHNYNVEYYGHPLIDEVNDFICNYKNINFFEKYKINSSKKIIALLPGSRKQEVEKNLIIMKELENKFLDYQFIVAANSLVDTQIYQQILKNSDNIQLIFDDTYNILNNSFCAIVTSGTATLETALFGIPQIVCYKGSYLSYIIAKKLIKIKYISLVNLIYGKEIVKELIQNDFNEEYLNKELKKLIDDNNYMKIKNNYKELKLLLGSEHICNNIAQSIFNQ